MIRDEIVEVLNSLPVEFYLDREGIEYRQTHGSSGAQFNLKTCPACGTSKWKVFLNQNTGLGNCFSGSCEKKFNKFSFIRESSGLSGKGLDEHILQIGRELGWRPARKSLAVSTESRELVLPVSIELPVGERNLSYLTRRNITKEATKYFNLRFSKDSYWDAGEHVVDFSNRVIIPIFDLEGNLVSFQGRDITGNAEKKYLFPSGFASTGEHLYNGHNAVNTKRILIGEGVFDVIAAKVALDEDPDLRDVVPVGTFGKHLAEGQVNKLRLLKERGVEEVTFMWDGEFAAIDAAVKSGLKAKALGLRVRIAILPPGKDPNEIPAEVLRHKFYSAIPLNNSTVISLRMKIRSEQSQRKS